MIAAWAYNPSEFWATLKAIRKEGWEFEVISTKPVIEEERTRNERFKVRTLNEFSLDEIKSYAGLTFVGGNPRTVEKYFYDPKTRLIVEAFNQLRRPIAAVCATVPSIRHIAKGKRITAFPSSKTLSLLKRTGAIISDNSLEVDGNIITAQHEGVIERMMEELIKQVKLNE